MTPKPDHIHLAVSGGSILMTKRDSAEGPSFGLSVTSMSNVDVTEVLSGEADEDAYFDAHSMRALAYAILSMVED